MDYVVSGLSPAPFRHLYGLTEGVLHTLGARRYIADAHPGYPDRVEMRDARVGESLLLLNHVSMPQDTPYRASHAIFVLEGAQQAFRGENEIPQVLFTRPMSLRAFDASGMMVDAELARGTEIEPAIWRLLGKPGVAEIHAHNALRGCYAGKITRLD